VLVEQQSPNLITKIGHNYQLSEVIRYRAWVEINQNAIAHNVRQIKSLLSGKTGLMAVVKADGYGHGAVRVAEIALEAGANCLAIATLGEGIELREAGITAPILVLGAINTPDEIKAVQAWNLQPTLCNNQQALVFSETLTAMGQVLPVHIKLDTGMSRLGMNYTQASEFVELIQKLPNLQLKSIYSHLATADDPDPTMMNRQQERFNQAIAKIKSQGIKLPCLHFANSAATLTDQSLHYDLVRIGLALYGLYPASHLKTKVNLKPVLQVKARITQVKTITEGTGVSYGHRFIADRDMAIAVVGIGYADGVPRNLSNQLQVLVRGQLVPQIGSITMDQLMIDVSKIPNLQPGEIVTLIGKDGDLEISADDWANQLGTISWEILCGFKHRLPRVKC
jgi:alanine racemase